MQSAANIGELAGKALRGDESAWRAIVGRTSSFALAMARRRLPASLAAQAEDAVQEAFISAFCNLDALREPEAFKPWLAAIVRSQCARLIAGAHPTISLDRLDDCGLMPPSGAEDPADALQAMRLKAAFDEALEALPPRLRDVSRRHYLGGLSSAEIAETCGLPEGTVKKRLHSARPLLQCMLRHFRGETMFRVGYMPITDHLLAMVAQHLGRGRGLPLLMRRYLSWTSLARDLERGRLDAAFVMAPLALSLHLGGVKLAYVMDSHHEGSSLSVSNRLERRRPMALPGPLSTHRVLLGRIGLDRPEWRDTPTTVVNPSSVVSSMHRQEIDAFFCAEPWSTKCLREGVGRTLMRSKDILPGHLCCILAVRREFADHNGALVGDYVRRLLQARDRVRADPVFGAAVQSAMTGIAADIALSVLTNKSVSFDDLAPDAGRLAAFAHLARGAGVLPDGGDLGGFLCQDFF